MLSIWIFIFSAFIITILLFLFRPLVPKIDSNERLIINGIIAWSVTFYALIVAFSITIFYARYISIRDTVVEETTNLRIIYKIFRELPDSENVINSIKNYINNVITTLIPNLREQKYPA